MPRNSNIPRDESWINDPVTGEEIGWRETYGIHSLERLPMEENRVPGPPLYVREFNRLAVTARYELRAAGEQTDQEITEPFELQTLGGVRDDRSIHDALMNWFEAQRIILRRAMDFRLHSLNSSQVTLLKLTEARLREEYCSNAKSFISPMF